MQDTRPARDRKARVRKPEHSGASGGFCKVSLAYIICVVDIACIICVVDSRFADLHFMPDPLREWHGHVQEGGGGLYVHR